MDDDCDGIVDPGLAARLSDGSRVWTAVGSSSGSRIDVLSRSGGGGWVLRRGASPGPLTFHSLDDSGRATGSDQMLDRTTDLQAFQTASDGKFIALLASFGSLNANDVASSDIALKVVLYKADDLSFVSEHVVSAPGDVTCGQIMQQAVAVQQDDEQNVQVAIVSATIRASIANNQCMIGNATGNADVNFLTYKADGTWAASTTPALSLPGAAYLFAGPPIKLTPLPCAQGWLVASASAGGEHLMRRYSFSGAQEADYDSSVSDVPIGVDVHADQLDCDAGTGVLVLAYADGSTLQTALPHIRRWNLAKQASSLPTPDDYQIFGKPLVSMRVRSSGGRVFVAGLDFRAGPHLIELQVGQQSAREIELHSLTTPMSSYTDADLQQGLTFLSTFGTTFTNLVDVGSTLVVVDSELGLTTGLEAAREPGDTNSPVGVTYRIGCAQ